MNHFYRLLFLAGILFSSTFFSQNRTEDFNISLPEKKAEKSLYKTLTIIDARVDSTNLGIVQKGAFNAKARVVPTIPLKNQFQALLNTINGNDAGNGELVLYLKQLSFAEITGSFSEKGYCYFQAFLFNKTDDGRYQPLNKIDSVITHSSMDVTKATMRKGSEMISDFIVKNIDKQNSSQEFYSFNDLINYDKIEKSKIPLYNAEKLNDGLYTDFESFKDQKPSTILVTNVKTGPDKEKIIRIYNQVDTKEKEIKKQDYYALIYQSQPYIYSELENSFLKLTKREDGDLYFIGRAKSNPKMGNVVLATAFFGIIGGLVASSATANFESKLDYLNGGFIPVKEIKK
ncbi:hypothetical protein [Halpernia frigidisoli]|uniref:Uncharacterized protein n=1 Tax=Halpernia frigidisoli TaxID=1125876 RepID=A0A1I3HW42_9FLAO|nr:hypothetical protein [Halpernia frigidisoli]SFI39966.1 hypothetical protein SAMN05443292_2424 [Halpernia frigidisoli]